MIITVHNKKEADFVIAMIEEMGFVYQHPNWCSQEYKRGEKFLFLYKDVKWEDENK